MVSYTYNSSRSDASRLVDEVFLQRSGWVALRASVVLRKKSYSGSCAKVRKSALAIRSTCGGGSHPRAHP